MRGCWVRTMRIASNGHRTAHKAHPVQVAASCNRDRLGPQVCLPCTCSDNTCGAHTTTHQPHSVQRLVSMTGNALRGAFMGGVEGRSSRIEPGARRPRQHCSSAHAAPLVERCRGGRAVTNTEGGCAGETVRARPLQQQKCLHHHPAPSHPWTRPGRQLPLVHGADCPATWCARLGAQAP